MSRHIVPMHSHVRQPLAAPAQLTYGNGPLLTSVKVTTIFWGAAWQQPAQSGLVPQVNQFFDFVLTSSLLNLLAQYSVPGKFIGVGARIGTATVTASEPGGGTNQVSDAQIQQALQGWINNGTVAAADGNTLYFVYLPPNVTVTDPQGGASCTQLCGYHWYIAGTNPQIYYAVMPFPGCGGCLGSLGQFQALTSTSSHELCEAITDPQPWSGWNDSNNGEIGDICAWQTQVLGGYTVQTEWSNSQNVCSIAPPAPTSYINVRRSTGHDFGPGPQANEDWSHGPCYGSIGTYFADVDGDGKAEVILVNSDTITVRRNTGSDFGPGPQDNEDWSHGPCYGSIGTFFADVTGDGKADCILVNSDTITVRRSTGHDFGPGPQANEDWTHGACYGSRGTFFADVTGDGKADCILVNDDTITVRRSTGSDFGPGPQANEDWTHGACYGSIGTFFADVTGDGKADCILVNADTITVRRSTGGDFGPGPQANEDWTHGACYGGIGTYFADGTGDGKADCILVNTDTVTVRRSTGGDFGPGPQANEDWTHGPYLGNRGIFFADVTGDGRADAIVDLG